MAKKTYRSFFVFEDYHGKTTKITEVRVPKKLGYDAFRRIVKQRQQFRFTQRVVLPFWFALSGIKNWTVEYYSEHRPDPSSRSLPGTQNTDRLGLKTLGVIK